MKDLLDTATAARYLGVAEQTLANWRWLDKGLTDAEPRRGPRWIKVGSRIKYDRHDLDAWIDANASDHPAQQAV